MLLASNGLAVMPLVIVAVVVAYGAAKNRTRVDHWVGSAGAADRRGRGRHGSGVWIMISVITSTTIQTAIAAAAQ